MWSAGIFLFIYSVDVDVAAKLFENTFDVSNVPTEAMIFHVSHWNNED